MALLKLGFVLNPVAGAGGPAALKGSDATSTRDAVFSGELATLSQQRAVQFFSQLKDQLKGLPDSLVVYCVAGPMGSAVLDTIDFPYKLVNCEVKLQSNAEDTKAACRAMLEQNIDLLVFAGGDGTARDVTDAVGDRCACIGIPAGVKMQSAVFGVHPKASADVVLSLLKGESVSIAKREVRDIDEKALGQGVVNSRFYGELKVPYIEAFVQNVKQGGVAVDELVILDMVDELRERLAEDEDTILIFGPGSTTQHIQGEMGFNASLLGVDYFGAESALDIDEQTLYELLLANRDKKFKLILTIIGGQGHLLGRGNQQFSPRVLKLIGRENLWIVAASHKLENLQHKALFIDSGDPELDTEWSGLIEIICGYQDIHLLKLQS